MAQQAGEQRKDLVSFRHTWRNGGPGRCISRLIRLDPRRCFLLPLVLEAAFQSSFFQGITVRQESRSGWEWYIDYIEEI
jgi:hypothetical protein